jgi:hypothetical protein
MEAREQNECNFERYKMLGKIDVDVPTPPYRTEGKTFLSHPF